MSPTDASASSGATPAQAEASAAENGAAPAEDRLPSAAEVGGKAAVLFELERAGFRVPPTQVSPPDLARAVEEVGFPIAVRSSATCEDGRESSFAGQFESFLELRSLAEVEQAVARCRASIEAPHVAEYCRKSGLDPASVRMEVIVQRMIQPELAGVAFTVNPVTGVEEVVIEAVEGLADDLLSGRASSLAPDHPLLVRHRPAIEQAARAVQRHFGAPQDVEFAIERGELYLLQARPITRIGFAPELGEWTNADFRDGGVSSDVCTPLMWSLYDTIWESSLKGFLRRIRLLRAEEDFQAGRMVFGRPYWNLGGVKMCLARLPGFDERSFHDDLSIATHDDAPNEVTPVTLLGLLRAIPTLRAIGGLYRELEATGRAFLSVGYPELEARCEARLEQARPGDAAAIIAAFHDLIEQGYRPTETRYFDTIFIATIAKIDFSEAFPDADYPALVAALPEMEHLAPTRALRAMAARGETDIAPLLRRFRHHSRRELDLRVPRWDEDPEFVRALLAQLGGGPAGEDPRPAYERARAAARRSVPWYRRRAFDRKLDRLRTFLWLREELRDRSMRMYYLVRRAVLALAAARGLGDDAFFMTWQELLAGDRSQVARAREVYDSYRAFAAPNEIGARFTGGGAIPADGALRGIGASQGSARGTARVARTVEEALHVEQGAILVCPFTDPGWTPVLDRVAGVVTETGGMLSHAAVICREYGIPAVLGVPQATRRIPDGAQVRIDGGAGAIELL